MYYPSEEALREGNTEPVGQQWVIHCCDWCSRTTEHSRSAQCGWLPGSMHRNLSSL